MDNIEQYIKKQINDGEETLEFMDEPIGDTDAQILANHLKGSRFTSLLLVDTKISDSGVIAIADSLPQSNITFLVLETYQDIGANGIIAIANTLKNTKITELCITYGGMGVGVVSAIAANLHSSNITSLTISCAIDDIKEKGMQTLATNLQNSKITSLNLSHCYLGDKNISIIAENLNHSHLELLNLDDNAIGDIGAVAIAFHLQYSKLTELILSGNNIENAGAVALGYALPNSSITSLDLSYNKIGDDASTTIANNLQNSKITSFSLSNNLIGDIGINAFVNHLQDYKLLVKFDICDNNSIITNIVKRNTGLLEKAQGMIKGRICDIMNHPYTKEEIEALQVFGQTNLVWQDVKENITGWQESMSDDIISTISNNINVRLKMADLSSDVLGEVIQYCSTTE